MQIILPAFVCHPITWIVVTYILGYAIMINVKRLRYLQEIKRISDYDREEMVYGMILWPFLWPILVLYFLLTVPSRIIARK